MRTEEIQRCLKRLRLKSPDIQGAALVSREGFIIASILPENVEEEAVAAVTASFHGLAERAAEEMARGRPRRFFVETDAGYVAAAQVGEEAFLTVLANRFGKPGMLLLDLGRTVRELERIV